MFFSLIMKVTEREEASRPRFGWRTCPEGLGAWIMLNVNLWYATCWSVRLFFHLDDEGVLKNKSQKEFVSRAVALFSRKIQCQNEVGNTLRLRDEVGVSRTCDFQLQEETTVQRA